MSPLSGGGCDPIWHVSSRSGSGALCYTANCYSRLLYFTLLLINFLTLTIVTNSASCNWVNLLQFSSVLLGGCDLSFNQWRRQGARGKLPPYGWTSKNYVICVCFHCYRTSSYHTTNTLQGRRAKSHVDTQTIQPGLGDFVL